ncbi:class I SAM-dependent methyltransferase [Glycomyces xiaoerkulensis]|uniref:class I SAM-dependent methyltransferase n=1 Tax=Glycomyces xiaoerkulensis TaxID=2038139 RepID=UPI000DEEA025|nr:class I SAM-dependent methyltransferase [Glycomyces xiaoerkulensis]
MTEADFRDVYSQQGRYDELLLPHVFGNASDVDLAAEVMRRCYGDPSTPGLDVCDLGCGTGRVTAALAPYAASLCGVDSSQAMIVAFTERFPDSRTVLADLPDAVTGFEPASFDVIGAFWSLSYPIMAYFESLDTDGITPHLDRSRAVAAARRLIDRIVRLLKPGGHLLIEFFDSDSPEQRVVSRLWERLAPHPGGDRSFSRQILLDALTRAERDGRGTLQVRHFDGIALAPDADAARGWFLHVHAKSHPLILNDRRTEPDVATFIAANQCRDGSVHLPAGVYLIEFTAGEDTDA